MTEPMSLWLVSNVFPEGKLMAGISEMMASGTNYIKMQGKQLQQRLKSQATGLGLKISIDAGSTTCKQNQKVTFPDDDDDTGGMQSNDGFATSVDDQHLDMDIKADDNLSLIVGKDRVVMLPGPTSSTSETAYKDNDQIEEVSTLQAKKDRLAEHQHERILNQQNPFRVHRRPKRNRNSVKHQANKAGTVNEGFPDRSSTSSKSAGILQFDDNFFTQLAHEACSKQEFLNDAEKVASVMGSNEKSKSFVFHVDNPTVIDVETSTRRLAQNIEVCIAHSVHSVHGVSMAMASDSKPSSVATRFSRDFILDGSDRVSDKEKQKLKKYGIPFKKPLWERSNKMNSLVLSRRARTHKHRAPSFK
jgi:hypothetical protein